MQFRVLPLVLVAACSSFPAYSLRADVADGAVVDGGGPVGDGQVATDGGVLDDAGPPSLGCTPPIPAVDPALGFRQIVGDGTGASCTQAALVAAIAAVNRPGGGTVVFNCGPGLTTIPITTPIVLPLDQPLTLDGGGQIVLDGGGTTRIMERKGPGYRSSSQTINIQQLTFRRGKSTDSGGAIYANDGRMNVYKCRFENNASAATGAVRGGAIYSSSSTSLQVSSSTFVGNTASMGGAIGTTQTTLSLYDVTFEGNKATGSGGAEKGGEGGAVFTIGSSSGAVTYCGVRMKGNEATEGGGGATMIDADPVVIASSVFQGNLSTNNGASTLALQTQNLEVRASTFLANAGKDGAVALNGPAKIVAENTSFLSNSAGFAAFQVAGSSGVIRNCTFANNHAIGATWGAAILGATPQLAVTNSLFMNQLADNSFNENTPLTCSGNVGSVTTKMTGGDGTLQFPGGVQDPACAPKVTFVDAKLAAVDASPIPVAVPAADSPARNAATVFCPAADANGNRRPATGCTAGAAQ